MTDEFYIDADAPKSKDGQDLMPIPTTKLSPIGRNAKKIDLEWRTWLVENAKQVIKNTYQLTLIKAVDVHNFSNTDGYMLNELLFGNPNTRINYKSKKVGKML